MAGFGTLISTAAGFRSANAQDAAADAAQRAFAPSAEERAFQRNAFAASNRDIARREAEIVELSRALTAAGSNLGDLLEGKESATLGPLRKEIDRRRSQLRQQLKQRLGPGFETSSSGQQALAEFERQSEIALSGAQQASIGQLAGIAQGPRRGVVDPIAGNLLNTSLGQRTTGAQVATLGELGNLTRASTVSEFGKSVTNDEQFGKNLLGSLVTGVFGGGGGGQNLTGGVPTELTNSSSSPLQVGTLGRGMVA